MGKVNREKLKKEKPRWWTGYGVVHKQCGLILVYMDKEKALQVNSILPYKSKVIKVTIEEVVK